VSSIHKGDSVSDIVNVAAVTAYTDRKTVDRCFEVGMVEVLHKPVSQDGLQELMIDIYNAIGK